jgi:hypothetical protein
MEMSEVSFRNSAEEMAPAATSAATVGEHLALMVGAGAAELGRTT